MKRSGFKRKIGKPMRRTSWSKIDGTKDGIVKKEKKPKQIGKAKLHKDLWKLFSKFIRERDGYICFTCGKKTWPAQAGHYITGATCKKYLFFDERNVNCQCYHCNINLSGNWPAYQRKMHLKYGPKIDREFEIINQKDGWNFPYQEKIEHYSKIVKL